MVALETHGSACFYHSVAANRAPADDAPAGVTLRTDDTHGVRVAHVAELRSKATSLGASEPSAGVVRAALDRAGGVKCVTVPDEVTMQLAGAFAGEKSRIHVHVATPGGRLMSNHEQTITNSWWSWHAQQRWCPRISASLSRGWYRRLESRKRYSCSLCVVGSRYRSRI